MFFLDFEDKLEAIHNDKNKFLLSGKNIDGNFNQKLADYEKKEKKELIKIYSKLTPWQIVKIARHSSRPKSSDYINLIFSDFTYLSGDRLFSEDNSILSGIGRIDNQSFLVLGNEKGRDMETRIKHNFGMAKPEGYRKCQRIMELADKFQLPLLCFIDTSGAFPGKEAEERGQAEAIAKSMQVSLNIETPSIAIVIGEGGSGGAIALGTCDKVLMLSNSIYSVISPEGCSSILWKSSSYAELASNSLKITAKDCLNLNIIDEIIQEPLGGAHRNHNDTCESVKKSIFKNLTSISNIDYKNLKIKRNKKYLNYII